MNGRLVVAFVLTLLLAAGAVWFIGFRSSGGPGVAKENPCDVFPSLDGALASWMKEQRGVQPALTCEHFELASDATPPVEAAKSWADADQVMGTAPRRWRSPGNQRMLLPSAESLSLIDLAGGTRRVLLRARTGERWSDGGWMDEQSFVAAGSLTQAGMTAPMLTVFRIDANRVTTFRGPPAPAQ